MTTLKSPQEIARAAVEAGIQETPPSDHPKEYVIDRVAAAIAEERKRGVSISVTGIEPLTAVIVEKGAIVLSRESQDEIRAVVKRWAPSFAQDTVFAILDAKLKGET